MKPRHKALSAGSVSTCQWFSNFRKFSTAFGTPDAIIRASNRIFDNFQIAFRIFRYHFFDQPVAPMPFLPKGKGRSIDVRFLLPDDSALTDLPLDDTVLKNRFAQDAICLGAFKQNKIVGCLWLCFSRYIEDDVRCIYLIDPEENIAWGIDAYVVPEARGGFTFLRLCDAANGYLWERGIDRLVSRISAFDPKSLASQVNLDGRRFASAIFVRSGRFQLAVSTLRPFVHISFSPRRVPQFVFSRS